MSRKPTVTQLVDFSKCETLGVLKLHKKENLNARRQAAVDHGVSVHGKMERQVAIDGRCFIATFALGPEAAEVVALRAFRDQVLSNSASGVFFIQCYYACSPTVVAVLRRLPGGRAFARRLILWLSDRLERP